MEPKVRMASVVVEMRVNEMLMKFSTTIYHEKLHFHKLNYANTPVGLTDKPQRNYANT